MKPLHVLVMAALVGAGILIYDTVKGEPRVEAPQVDVEPRVQTPASSGAPPAPTVDSSVVTGLMARIQELEERLAAQEARPDAPALGASPGTTPPPPPGWTPGSVPEGEEPEFDPEALAWFRAMEEVVARQRRDEATAKSIQLQLKRAGIEMDPTTTQAVVDATVAYRARNRELYQDGTKKGLDADARREILEKSRNRFRGTLEAIAPRDAERIHSVLGRYPGFRPTGPFARER